jgi:hypothetical protein
VLYRQDADARSHNLSHPDAVVEGVARKTAADVPQPRTLFFRQILEFKTLDFADLQRTSAGKPSAPREQIVPAPASRTGERITAESPRSLIASGIAQIGEPAFDLTEIGCDNRQPGGAPSFIRGRREVQRLGG